MGILHVMCSLLLPRLHRWQGIGGFFMCGAFAHGAIFLVRDSGVGGSAIGFLVASGNFGELSPTSNTVTRRLGKGIMGAHSSRMACGLVVQEWTLAVFMPYVLDWSFHTGQGTFTSWTYRLQRLSTRAVHDSWQGI